MGCPESEFVAGDTYVSQMVSDPHAAASYFKGCILSAVVKPAFRESVPVHISHDRARHLASAGLAQRSRLPVSHVSVVTSCSYLLILHLDVAHLHASRLHGKAIRMYTTPLQHVHFEPSTLSDRELDMY